MDFVPSEDAAEQFSENVCFLRVAACYISITPDMVQTIRIGVLKSVHGKICLFVQLNAAFHFA